MFGKKEFENWENAKKQILSFLFVNKVKNEAYNLLKFWS